MCTGEEEELLLVGFHYILETLRRVGAPEHLDVVHEPVQARVDVHSEQKLVAGADLQLCLEPVEHVGAVAEGARVVLLEEHTVEREYGHVRIGNIVPIIAAVHESLFSLVAIHALRRVVDREPHLEQVSVVGDLVLFGARDGVLHLNVVVANRWK